MDQETLAELFRRYGDDVFRLAYSYLGSRADGEDVCQTVFLKLAEGRAVLLPGREKAWLLTCAANLCRSQLRSFWRRNVGALDESVPFPEPAGRAVWSAVQALPPNTGRWSTCITGRAMTRGRSGTSCICPAPPFRPGCRGPGPC